MHLGLFCALLLLLSPAGQAFAASWRLANDQVTLEIAFDEHGLYTESLRLEATGTEFVRGPSQEFSFQAGGRTLSGRSSWILRSANQSALAGGRTLTIELADRHDEFDVAVHYALYSGEPAVRRWLTIRNRSRSLQTLTHLSFAQLNASPCEPHECAVTAGYGSTPRELFLTGRVADAAIFVRNMRTGEGLAVINEAPGYLKRTEIGESWGTRSSAMYDTDLFPFERTLEPGESFDSAKCSLVLFKDGAGFLDSHWAIPGYMARIVMRRGQAFRPAWIYNTWEPFERGINEALVDQLTPIAGRMKFDVFTIDDGWQLRYGANEVNRTSFPGGLDAAAAQLKAQGVRLGLWVPLAAIGVDTPDYKAHPQWVCLDAHRRPKITNTASGPQGLMCLGSGYRELALKRLSDLIDRYHLAYIKVDLTTVFNAYGEEPGCHAEGHFHRSWAESLDRIYEGLEYIGGKLYKKYPNVLVDYTFELWGEKHLIDAALLGVADLDWLSNIADRDPESAGPRQARMLLYQRAASIPSETMLIGNLHAGVAPIEERFATAIGSSPLLLGDLRSLSTGQQSWWGKQVSWYRALRARASLLDSFFPLGEWRQPGHSGGWDGFARLSRSGDGLIAIFRNTASEAEVRVIAPAHASYTARSVFDNRDLGRVGSMELNAGWPVKLDGDRAATVIELHRMK